MAFKARDEVHLRTDAVVHGAARTKRGVPAICLCLESSPTLGRVSGKESRQGWPVRVKHGCGTGAEGACTCCRLGVIAAAGHNPVYSSRLGSGTILQKQCYRAASHWSHLCSRGQLR